MVLLYQQLTKIYEIFGQTNQQFFCGYFWSKFEVCIINIAKVSKMVLLTHHLSNISEFFLPKQPSNTLITISDENLMSLRLLQPKLTKMVLSYYQLTKFSFLQPNHPAIFIWLILVKI